MDISNKIFNKYNISRLEITDLFLRNILNNCENDTKKIKHLAEGYARLLKQNKDLMNCLSIKSKSGTNKIVKKYANRNLFKVGILSQNEIQERFALGATSSDYFFKSTTWKKFRYKMFQELKKQCVSCGSINNLHLDHIKPRSLYPELAFDPDNMQILCGDCNLGKSNTTGKQYKIKKK